MSQFERWLLHLSNLAVGGTGLVYAVMLYAMQSDDPFSVVNHPLQPRVQHLHVLVAPLFIFAVGVIWRRHIWTHWSTGVRRGRRSGIGLMLLLLPMIASGYLLQTAVAPEWRQAWIVVHLATSAIWLLAFVGHFLTSRRQTRRSRQRVQAPGLSASGTPPTVTATPSSHDARIEGEPT